MKRETTYSLMLGVAAAAAVFVASVPMLASETDERIESSYKQSYVYKAYLQDDSVEVDSQDGVVTLTGTVSEDSHKALAEELMAGVLGVSRVDNQLSTTAEAAMEDAWLVRRVKLTLLFHRNFSGGKTNIEVKNGVVTLTGEATSDAQKQLATEYAADIEGVKGVNNEMVVAERVEREGRTADEKIDDASVTALVKMALTIHLSTSSVTTKVETRNGAVTLTGIAENAAEKALVTKLTGDIHGVTAVNNEMTIEADRTM